jgi:hypothetical protein
MADTLYLQLFLTNFIRSGGRADVIMDFTGLAVGTEIILKNMPDHLFQAENIQILKQSGRS